LKKDIKDIVDSCFISKYSTLFNNYLQKLSPETRDIIRKNKELNDLFDLFLDYTIDASQHLDYLIAKESEKNLTEKNIPIQ
jgi:hypothetical protein